MTRRPIAAPVARAIASVRSSVSTPAMTSTSFITGAGLKKCMPTTRSGQATGAAIAVIGIDEVFEASTHVSATTPASSANSACLSSGSSGAASMTSSHGASSVMSSTASTRSHAARTSSALSFPRAFAPSSPSSTRDGAALRRTRDRVVEQRPRARRRGELRDAGAHRPGAGDADDGGQPARPVHADTGSASRSTTIGLSASMPVASRPMMSCWIWLVPS